MDLLDRVPPQNLDAESSVLGSILLDNDAAWLVAQYLKPEHFYKAANQKIYAGVLALAKDRKPIDIVILAEELGRQGALEATGGKDYLRQLVDAVPSAANAEYYARLVIQKAMLRSLITVATEIVKDAYNAEGPAEAVLDGAEKKFFEATTKRIAETASDLKSLLHEEFDRIQKGGALKGVMTNLTDLDHTTNGFRPSELIILAARPSMGKTSLASSFIRNVAIYHALPVVFYSLEMSKQQVTQNMLCSEARVDSFKMRKGELSQVDLDRLRVAAGRLYDAPIFIDDASCVSIMELRAKARMMKLRHGIGMIVIDYLQLMEGEKGRSGDDNRAQEISTISRGLKQLARELECPVIALSQLNRGVENREGHKPRLSDLRECVVGDTLVSLSDGRRVPIRDLVGMKPSVWAMSPAGKVVAAESDRVWSVGRRPVFDVRLASGRSIRATARHRLYAAGGWKRVSELAVDDRIAIARRVPEPATCETWPENRLVLLAHLIGDGSYLKHKPLRYTTGSEENSEAVARAARVEFGLTVNRHAGRGNWHQLVLSGNGNRWHPAGANLWLRELGIFDQRSHEKRVPPEVFRLSNSQIAFFVKHLWATDGCIHTPRESARGGVRIFFATNSRGLALDVAALLLRLEVVARVRTTRQGKYRPVFSVDVSGVTDQKRFLDVIGAFGPRAPQAARALAALEAVAPNPNVDTLPRETFARVREPMRERGITQRGMAAMRGTAYGGASHFKFSPSRATVAHYAELLDADELRQLAESDLFWDRIVSIEPAGEEEVFDLTVPGPASWLADATVSHNSGSIEQDADMVLMLYREAYYKPEVTDPKIANRADVIVGKNRNGPVGQVPLYFHKEYTRFDNWGSGDG